MTATAERLAIDEQNPWPGLSAFDEDAERFFNGRRDETAALRRLVMQAPLTVLFGASGLGKTSLLQAGLFPLLRHEHFLPVHVRLDLRDREAPLIDQVKHALETEIRARSVDAPALAESESLWEYLHRAGFELWSEQNQILTPLFAFDQFEEVFTLGAANPGAIAQLRVDLADLIENRMPGNLAVRQGEDASAALSLDAQRYKVLLSFREDFLPAVEGWKREIPSIMRNRLRLLAMSADQAFEAVHLTAPHLADETMARQIVSFVAAAGEENAESPADVAVEPALLSLVCHGLNEKRKAQARKAFDEALLKGTGQAIVADFYRSAIADVPAAVQRFIERELITERGFRKPSDVDDARRVHGVTDEQLRLLVDRRLLRIEPVRGTERVELTHDLLTRVVREHRDRQRERERRARERRRLTWIGSVLGGIALLMALLYRQANEQTRLAQAMLEQVRMQTEIAKAATQSADSQRRGAEASKATAEAEARSALSHLLAGAAINAAVDRKASAIAFALQAIATTRDVDHTTVLHDAEDALRRVVTALGVTLPRPGHTSDISSIDFSSDGKRVATMAQDGLRIWDAALGEQLSWIENGSCVKTVLSSDWKKMMCGNPRENRVLDMEKGTEVRSLSAFTVTNSRAGSLRQFGMSSDGKLLLAGDDKKVMISDGASYSHEFPGSTAVLSSDGMMLATVLGEEKRVKVWDVKTGRDLLTLEATSPRRLVFSPDGKRLAAGGETTYIWDLVLGRKVVERGGSIGCLAFSPDSSRLLVDFVGSPPEMLNASSGESFYRFNEIWTSDWECRFTSNGSYLFTTGINRSLVPVSAAQIWSIGATAAVITRRVEASEIALSPDGSVLATAYGATGTIEDVRTGAITFLPSRDMDVAAAAFSPDRKRVITTGDDSRVRIWDTSSASRLSTLIGHKQPATALAYSADGNLIATAGLERVARLWDARSGRFLRDLTGHTDRILGIAISPDSRRVATAGYDRTVRIWDATTGKDLTAANPLRLPASQFSVNFSADGKRLASLGNEGGLWDALTFRAIALIPRPNGLASALALSPDGQILAAALSNGVYLWRQGSEWELLPGSVGGRDAPKSAGLAFNRDGTRLVTAGVGHTFKIWDTGSHKEVSTLYYTGDTESFRAIAFSADEKYINAIGQDGVIYQTPLLLDDLIAEARRRLGNNFSLSSEDCAAYLRQPCPADVKRKP